MELKGSPPKLLNTTFDNNSSKSQHPSNIHYYQTLSELRPYSRCWHEILTLPSFNIRYANSGLFKLL
jgi:hypothetical protein